jgi:CRP-like cAMP-binding protein
MLADHLAKLAAWCRHVEVPARQRLLHEGQTADRFWLIDAGQAELDASVPGHGRLIIDTLGRGDVLGLSWILPPCRRSGRSGRLVCGGRDVGR